MLLGQEPNAYTAARSQTELEPANPEWQDGWKAKAPSFVIVGPPRTGTSWLHEVLRPRVSLPEPTKETRFFDLHFHRGWQWYFDHFSPRQDRPVGEVAPTYFASRYARTRIAQFLPQAKIVFIFRHPVERMVSLYRLKLAYGTLACSFEDALERDPELIESSLYATNLREWISQFPSRQISINLYEDLSRDPQGFVDRLAKFLEISPFQLEKSQLSQVYSTQKMTEPRSYLATKTASALADWCKARQLDHVVAAVRNSVLIKLLLGGGAPFSEIPPQSLHKVHTLLRDETDELETMLGRDLSAWKAVPS